MASKRVTVFGGSGFLGRQIVKSLAAEGTNVRVAVRHRTARPGRPDTITTERLRNAMRHGAEIKAWA